MVLPPKNAATPILARTYLIQGNFAGARDAANAVIQSGNHALADTYDQVFDEEFGGFDGESISNSSSRIRMESTTLILILHTVEGIFSTI